MLPALANAASVAAAITTLERAGWQEIGRGDWSWVYGMPDGAVAVRLSPWDPAYALHVRLCVTHPENPYLQRVHRVDPIGPVGTAVWMERLYPANEERAISFCHALGIGGESNPEWMARAAGDWPAGDAALDALRTLLVTTLAEGARTLPLWGGSDVSPKNVLMDRRGQLKLVDPFFVSGRAIVDAMQRGDAAALAGYRAEELRAFLSIPVFTPGAELAALQAMLDRWHPAD